MRSCSPEGHLQKKRKYGSLKTDNTHCLNVNCLQFCKQLTKTSGLKRPALTSPVCIKLQYCSLNLMLIHKPLSTAFCMQLTKAYEAEASCHQVVIEMLFYLLEALNTLSLD